MNHRFAITVLLLLAACSGAEDVEYCARLGVDPEHPEYLNCLGYYKTQHGLYTHDWNACAREADKTYPPTLYDKGQTMHGGGFGFDVFGRYHGGGFGWVPPDAAHNAHVDALRNRIIEPCMQERGWRDPHDWEAGRTHASRNTKPKATPLPWAK